MPVWGRNIVKRPDLPTSISLIRKLHDCCFDEKLLSCHWLQLCECVTCPRNVVVRCSVRHTRCTLFFVPQFVNSFSCLQYCPVSDFPPMSFAIFSHTRDIDQLLAFSVRWQSLHCRWSSFVRLINCMATMHVFSLIWGILLHGSSHYTSFEYQHIVSVCLQRFRPVSD